MLAVFYAAMGSPHKSHLAHLNPVDELGPDQISSPGSLPGRLTTPLTRYSPDCPSPWGLRTLHQPMSFVVV